MPKATWVEIEVPLTPGEITNLIYLGILRRGDDGKPELTAKGTVITSDYLAKISEEPKNQ
jgi:hypothetical protein